MKVWLEEKLRTAPPVVELFLPEPYFFTLLFFSFSFRYHFKVPELIESAEQKKIFFFFTVALENNRAGLIANGVVQCSEKHEKLW